MRHRRGRERDVGFITLRRRRNDQRLFTPCDRLLIAAVERGPTDAPLRVAGRPVVKQHLLVSDANGRPGTQVPVVPRCRPLVENLAAYNRPGSRNGWRRGESYLRRAVAGIFEDQIPQAVVAAHDRRFLRVLERIAGAQRDAAFTEARWTVAGCIEHLTAIQALIPPRIVNVPAVALYGDGGIFASIAIVVRGSGRDRRLRRDGKPQAVVARYGEVNARDLLEGSSDGFTTRSSIWYPPFDGKTNGLNRKND